MPSMSGLGDRVSKNPKATIAIIIILTLLFSFFAKDFQSEADPEHFNPDNELIKVSEKAGEFFGVSQYGVNILVKAKDEGEKNNILEMEDMKALVDLEDMIRNDEKIGPLIVGTTTNPGGVSSVADLLVSAHNLKMARSGMDVMLMGFDASLSSLADLLDDPTASNETKASAMMSTLGVLSENLTTMHGGSTSSFPQFNRTASMATLDQISNENPIDPVPTFLRSLKEYDINAAGTATAALSAKVNGSLNRILPHTVLLTGMPMGPQEASMVLMGLQLALPTIEGSASSLDKAIGGMAFGAQAILTKDYEKSDGKLAMGSLVMTNFNTSLDKDEKSKLENRLHDRVKGMEKESHLKYGIIGDQLVNEEIQETMDVSQMFLMMLVIVLIIVILYFTFRNGFDTALTMICLVMAIIWSYGISILLGIQGSIIAQVVPILLVGLGVDYGIHMTMRFREERAKGRSNRKAVSMTITTVGMALLLATVTTSIGFMSNAVSKMSILRDFAVMVTIGIISSFVIMITFQPAVKLMVTNRRDRSLSKEQRKDAQMKRKAHRRNRSTAVKIVTFGAWAGDRAPAAVLLVLLLLSSMAYYGASQLDTVFDFREFLPEGTEARENLVFLIEEFEFGDEEFADIFIQGDMTDPAVLDAMQMSVDNMADDEQVLSGLGSRSIISIMQKYAHPLSAQDYNQSFVQTWASSDTDRDGIPDSNIQGLYDILYGFNGSRSEVRSVLHKDPADGTYDAGLMRMRVNSDNLHKANELQQEMEKDIGPIKDLESNHAIESVWIIGSPIVTNVVINEMNQGQVNSIMITIISSFIILTIVFFILERSWILGILSSIPVVLVILWILGTMFLFGYSLNVMTITIASLTVGMGVTYSIHIAERFTEDMKKFNNIGKACENTLRHTGMALAGAFATTSGGFGILFFHKLPPLQQFGVMIALSIAYSFLAAVYFLPTFLILWAKWKYRDREHKGRPTPKTKRVKKGSVIEGSGKGALGQKKAKVAKSKTRARGKQ